MPTEVNVYTGPPVPGAMTTGEMEAATEIATIVQSPTVVSYEPKMLLHQAADAVVRLHREAYRARQGWEAEVVCTAKEMLQGARPGKTKALLLLLRQRLSEIRGQWVTDADVEAALKAGEGKQVWREKGGES